MTNQQNHGAADQYVPEIPVRTEPSKALNGVTLETYDDGHIEICVPTKHGLYICSIIHPADDSTWQTLATIFKTMEGHEVEARDQRDFKTFVRIRLAKIRARLEEAEIEAERLEALSEA